MRKLTIFLALVLALVFSVNLQAESAQTVEEFWSSIFDEGDLKHAFSMLANEDQQYIQTIAPDAYNFIMGDVGQDAGEFAVIANSIKNLVLTTMGKLIKVEVADVNPTAGGDEVFYSMHVPADLEFMLKMKSWAEGKQQEFENMADSINPIEKISEVISELSEMLENVSFKTSVSINTYAVVIEEDGRDKVFLDLMGTQAKLMQLE
jgi:hypothetical protein